MKAVKKGHRVSSRSHDERRVGRVRTKASRSRRGLKEIRVARTLDTAPGGIGDGNGKTGN